MPVNISFTNRKVLEAADFVIANEIKGITTHKDFFKKIGFKYDANLRMIKSGKLSFRQEHIYNICKYFGFDANFFYRPNSRIYYVQPKNPFLLLKESTKLIEINYQKKS